MLARLNRKRLLPSALLVAACSAPSAIDGGADAGHDAGFDGGADPCADYDAGHDDSGVRCYCNSSPKPGGGYEYEQCCDDDIGNPCPICCLNPRDADGGRQYEPNDAGPVCYC